MGASVWFKQFGLERSGTNYVKALMEISCPDVRVLATLLGSKHAPPNLDDAVDKLAVGDVGIAVTDLDESDFPAIIAAYREHRMGVLLCVRDAVTWIDAYERHRARREKREPEILDRQRLEELTDLWITWIYDMAAWSATTPLHTFWVNHHEIVRKPQRLITIAESMGAQCGAPAQVGYLRKAGDRHGSTNVTSRPYHTRQYRDVYNGLGQIEPRDVDWVCSLVTMKDPQGLAQPFMWDRKPLRRRGQKGNQAGD